MTTAVAKRTTKKHPCARCGRKDVADRMVFSKWTRSHYCGPGRGCGKANG